jgi:hypothetical protein
LLLVIFQGKPEFKTGDTAAKDRIWNHAKTIWERMDSREQGKTTYAVAEVEMEDGERETWVAHAGQRGYVAPKYREGAGRVINNLHPDGKPGNDLNDAEGKIIREADKLGATIEALGATREMCPVCQAIALEHGIDLDVVVTPLKLRQ